MQELDEPDSPDLLADSPVEQNEKDDSNQINKWGFNPGEDDTQDLNLEKKGDNCLPSGVCLVDA